MLSSGLLSEVEVLSSVLLLSETELLSPVLSVVLDVELFVELSEGVLVSQAVSAVASIAEISKTDTIFFI